MPARKRIKLDPGDQAEGDPLELLAFGFVAALRNLSDERSRAARMQPIARGRKKCA